MNPVQPVQDREAIMRSNKKRLVWGLICLIGPTALLIISILAYAFINFITAQSGGIAGAEETIGATRSTGRTIVNVILYLVGATTVITWLPGIIGGIVLLATRKPLQQ